MSEISDRDWHELLGRIYDSDPAPIDILPFPQEDEDGIVHYVNPLSGQRLAFLQSLSDTPDVPLDGEQIAAMEYALSRETMRARLQADERHKQAHDLLMQILALYGHS